MNQNTLNTKFSNFLHQISTTVLLTELDQLLARFFTKIAKVHGYIFITKCSDNSNNSFSPQRYAFHFDNRKINNFDFRPIEEVLLNLSPCRYRIFSLETLSHTSNTTLETLSHTSNTILDAFMRELKLEQIISFQDEQEVQALILLKGAPQLAAFELTLFFDLVSLVFNNICLNQEVAVDQLTRLYRRPFFLQQSHRYLTKSSYYPVVAMMCDLDHFKRINDTYGHEVGDLALRSVTTCIKETFREQDLLCRYGGEEFMALLPKTTAAEGLSIAQRVRKKIEQLDIPVSVSRLSISIGMDHICHYDAAASIEGLILQLLRNTDSALYQAKNQGRNCVVYHQKNTSNLLASVY